MLASFLREILRTASATWFPPPSLSWRAGNRTAATRQTIRRQRSRGSKKFLIVEVNSLIGDVFIDLFA